MEDLVVLWREMASLRDCTDVNNQYCYDILNMEVFHLAAIAPNAKRWGLKM